jgi:hypothetical protein
VQPFSRALRGPRRVSRRVSPAVSRRWKAAAAVVASLPLLSGCASGFDSPVLQDYNPVTGVNVRQDEVWGMNLLVVLPESGQGTLVGALLNTTRPQDRLVDATVTPAPDDQAEVATTMVRQSVTLPPERLVELSDPQTVLVEGDVVPGRFVNLTLQFQRSEPIEVEVPVVAPEGPYADVPLPDEATPSAPEPESGGSTESNGGRGSTAEPGAGGDEGGEAGSGEGGGGSDSAR